MKFHIHKFLKQNLKNVFLKKQSFDRKIKEEHTSYFCK